MTVSLAEKTPVRAGIALVVVGLALVAAPANAQDPVSADRPSPTASDGGKAELLPPRPLADSADPLNQHVAQETVDGVVLVVTIDGASVTLDSATLARIPRRMARTDRATDGDAVKATAFAGGQAIATTVVPDNVINASEGDGLVRTTRRQITLTIASDRPIDTVQVEAPATGASGSLDVRSAYAQICDADPKSKWCVQRQQ